VALLTVDLYPYQEPAVEMLLERGNLLMAMDMGLGKTVTTIAAAEHLLGEGEVSTVLICAPTGLLYQWAAALAATTDVETRLRRLKSKTVQVPTEKWCVVIDGTPERKRRQIAQIKASPPQYVIASYATVADYVPLFERLAQMVAIDEATVLKGFKSARSKALSGLQVPWRVALTGDPVENDRPEEMWGIMRWVDSELLGGFRDFEQAHIRRDFFGRPVRYVDLHGLQAKLSPAMYRKRTTDSDVAGFVPGVKKDVWRVNLDRETLVVYKRLLRDLNEELSGLGGQAEWDIDAYYSGMDEGSGPGRVGGIQVAAQMLVDHPQLVRDSALRFCQNQKHVRNSGPPYVVRLAESGMLENLTSTPKLDILSRNVITILDDPASKVIVVTRFRGMIPILEKAFESYGVTRFDGTMSRTAKAESAARFNQDSDTPVMVMTHAGAYGLDLPSATHLINYDPARSSGQRKQIDARHVRAGSSHQTVNVVDLITEGTIEEWAYDLLAWKGRIASAITDGDHIGEDGVIRNARKPLTRYIAEILGDSC
jgi:SNF2 family DNA or RNA helicase